MQRWLQRTVFISDAQSGHGAVILLYVGIMGLRWGMPWRKRCSESVKERVGCSQGDTVTLAPVCPRLSGVQGLPRQGEYRALHLPSAGPRLDPQDQIRLFMTWATSEMKGIPKRKKKGQGMCVEPPQK